MDMTFAKRRSSRDRFSRVSLEKFRIRLYFLFLFGDAILMGGALLVIGSLYHGGRLFDGPGLELASAISPIFVILSFYLGLYSIQSLASLRKMALTVLHAAVVSALLYLIVSFFTKTTAETSRVVLTLTCSSAR